MAGNIDLLPNPGTTAVNSEPKYLDALIGKNCDYSLDQNYGMYFKSRLTMHM